MICALLLLLVAMPVQAASLEEARALFDSGDYDAALQEVEHAKQEELEGEADGLQLAELDNTRGLILQGLGRFEESTKVFESVIDYLEANDMQQDIPVLLLNLAHSWEFLGDIASARKELERALDILEAADDVDPEDMAKTLFQLGSVASAAGDHSAALELMYRGLELQKQALGPDSLDVGLSLLQLADVLAHLRRFDMELHTAEAAKTIIQTQVGEAHPLSGHALMALARALFDTDEIDKALATFGQAEASFAESLGRKHPFYANAINNHATVLSRSERYEEALPLYREAFAILSLSLRPDDANLGLIRHSMARALLRSGRKDEARVYVIDAEATAQRSVARLTVEGSAREAREVIRAFYDPLGLYLETLDHPDDAETTYDRVLFWKGAATRAARGRRLDDDASSRDRERHLQIHGLDQEITDLLFADFDGDKRTAIVDLRKRRDRIERELAADHPIELESVDYDALCAALPDDAALVDFVKIAGSYEVFVTRGGECEGPKRIRYLDVDTIDDAILAHQELLRAREPGAARLQKRGERVADLLLEPLLPLIEDRTRLVISPDQDVGGVSIASLPYDGGYALEKWTISYVEFSGDLLADHAPPHHQALIVGGVEYGPPGPDACPGLAFGELPYALVESQVLDKRLAKVGRKPTLLRGSAATEAAVRELAPASGVLHFATHGFVLSRECSNSLSDYTEEVAFAAMHPLAIAGLALAPSDPGDGIWTAAEVRSLDLRHTELVVLSSCDSGWGTAHHREGIIGLRSAFSSAGAHQLLIGLWQIQDESTSALMDAFYAEHLHRRRGLPVPEALRQAQLRALELNRETDGNGHPEQWGAFVVTGTPASEFGR